ncbi:MAG TPA: ATP-binding protein, partial [Campylobacterales bacterium]|nr:ATP-binding protein [Campylobacterales bacterium]
NARLNKKNIKNINIKDEALALLTQGVARFGLSERGRVKSLKVARTIADLEESEAIQKNHILEALSYRKR